MSARMKKHHTNQGHDHVCIRHAGCVYQFPIKIAEKYKVSDGTVSPEEVFKKINKKHSKPGALLRGIRVRENLTQVEMANLLKVTQSDVSQIENGARNIGRKVAQRIEKIFDIDYRAFLA
jgi:DNA-binding XRE family transcriptional regulator